MNYIWVFLGQNIGAVFTMLTLILILKIISSEEYGAMVAIQTYALLISNIFGIRTFNGVIKYTTDAESIGDMDRVKKYINTAFLFDALSGVLAFVCGFLLLSPIVFLMQWEMETMTYLNMYLPLVLFLPILNGTPIGVLRKLGYFKQVNIIHAIAFGFQCFVMFIVFLLDCGSLKLVLLIHALTEVMECLLLLAYSIFKLQTKAEFKNFWKAGFSRDWAFCKFNFFYGLSTCFDQILGHGSTLLINRFVGNLATAYIKIISQICGIITKFTNPLGQIIYPELCTWVSKCKFAKAYKISLKYFYVVCGAGLFLTGILFGTYDWWIGIFDEGMIEAKWQSLLYMMHAILSISIICVNQLIFALDLVKQNLTVTIIFNCFYLICLIPAIKMFGVYGYLVLQLLQLLSVFGLKLLFIKIKLRKNSSEES